MRIRIPIYYNGRAFALQARRDTSWYEQGFDQAASHRTLRAWWVRPTNPENQQKVSSWRSDAGEGAARVLGIPKHGFFRLRHGVVNGKQHVVALLLS